MSVSSCSVFCPILHVISITLCFSGILVNVSIRTFQPHIAFTVAIITVGLAWVETLNLIVASDAYERE